MAEHNLDTCIFKVPSLQVVGSTAIELRKHGLERHEKIPKFCDIDNMQ